MVVMVNVFNATENSLNGKFMLHIFYYNNKRQIWLCFCFVSSGKDKELLGAKSLFSVSTKSDLFRKANNQYRLLKLWKTLLTPYFIFVYIM
jgi:hypothetical protein